MRKDMAKVVTEKPRRGSSSKSQKHGGRLSKDDIDRALDTDDAGPSGLIAWSRYRNVDHKEFSDLLSPLRRYLRKQVGRRWDDIYSELSQTLDKRSLTGIHIWGHIRSEVTTQCYLGVSGRIWEVGRFGVCGRWEVQGLYVHPINGRLCSASEGASRYYPYPRAARTPKPITEIKLDDHNKLCQLKGIWYECHYAKAERYLSEQLHPRLRYTVRHGGFVDEEVLQHKRQLSTKELRARGLCNKNSV